MDNEGVTCRRAVHIERSSLRIAAQGARCAGRIVAASVHGPGVNGVTGVNGQHGLVRGGELAAEDGGRELVRLRQSRGCDNHSGAYRREGVRRWAIDRGILSPDKRARDAVARDRGGHVFIAALWVLCAKPELAVFDRSLQLVAAEFACHVIALLVERQIPVGRRAEGVDVRGPLTGQVGLLGCDRCREQQCGIENLHDAPFCFEVLHIGVREFRWLWR